MYILVALTPYYLHIFVLLDGEKHWNNMKNNLIQEHMVAVEGAETELLDRDSKPRSIRPHRQTNCRLYYFEESFFVIV